MDIYARKKRETEEAADSNDGGSGGGGGNITLDELNHREEIATQEWRRLLEETRGVQCDVTAEKREEIKHQTRLRFRIVNDVGFLRGPKV